MARVIRPQNNDLRPRTKRWRKDFTLRLLDKKVAKSSNEIQEQMRILLPVFCQDEMLGNRWSRGVQVQSTSPYNEFNMDIRTDKSEQTLSQTEVCQDLEGITYLNRGTQTDCWNFIKSSTNFPLRRLNPPVSGFFLPCSSQVVGKLPLSCSEKVTVQPLLVQLPFQGQRQTNMRAIIPKPSAAINGLANQMSPAITAGLRNILPKPTYVHSILAKPSSSSDSSKSRKNSVKKANQNSLKTPVKRRGGRPRKTPQLHPALGVVRNSPQVLSTPSPTKIAGFRPILPKPVLCGIVNTDNCNINALKHDLAPTRRTTEIEDATSESIQAKVECHGNEEIHLNKISSVNAKIEQELVSDMALRVIQKYYLSHRHEI